MLTVLLQGVSVGILHGLVGGRACDGWVVISGPIVEATDFVAYIRQRVEVVCAFLEAWALLDLDIGKLLWILSILCLVVLLLGMLLYWLLD